MAIVTSSCVHLLDHEPGLRLKLLPQDLRELLVAHLSDRSHWITKGRICILTLAIFAALC